MATLSALQVMVPAVDPLIAQLRPHLPAGTAVLDPGHISFGYPWLEPAAARPILDDVAIALSTQRAFDIELRGPRRFPPDARGRVTIHLAPRPRTALLALAAIVADASGHAPAEFTPHCSLIRLGPGVDPGPLEELVRLHVPVCDRLDTVQFHVRTERRGWVVERVMPLGSPA